MPRVKFGTFSLEAPGDWSLQTIILAGPPEPPEDSGGFQRNLITTLEFVGDRETASSYLQRQSAVLDQVQMDRVVVGPPEAVQLEGGHEGLLTEQVIRGQAGERVRQMQLVVVKDAVAHTTIASHLDGAPFEAAREAFRHMLLSFR